MDKLKKYYTRYLISENHEEPLQLYKGKGWSISFEKTADKSKGKRLVIYAASFTSAQNVLELINCSITLISGEANSFGEQELVVPESKSEYDRLCQENLDQFSNSYSFVEWLYDASKIAAMVSYKRTYKYALAKYKLATQLYSVPIFDLDNKYSNHYLGVSPYDIDHVRYAYSIVIAYSVIEEIGFEIRASKEKPSKINGKWNSEVRKDLEGRLSKRGVNLSDKFCWLLRGTPTRIKNPKQIKDASKAPWSNGLYCRDRLVDIADAIHQASFLRSKISAHRLSRIAHSLTPYDVENVRQLTRRLILERLGLWMGMIHKAHEIN